MWAEAQELGHSHGIYADVTAFPEGDSAPSASSCILAWLEAGLPVEHITCSSDGGGCLPVFEGGQMVDMDVGRPDTLLQAVRELTDAGLPLETAIRPFTRSPADLFRFGGKGRLEVGCDADVLVLNEELAPWGLWASGRRLLAEGRPIR